MCASSPRIQQAPEEFFAVLGFCLFGYRLDQISGPFIVQEPELKMQGSGLVNEEIRNTCHSAELRYEIIVLKTGLVSKNHRQFKSP